MKKIVIAVIMITVMSSLLFAQTEKVAVLSFEKIDKASDYVAKAIMSRDIKKIFSDYDQYELIDLKKTSKVLKKAGFSNISYLGKNDIAIIGNELEADIVIYGSIQSISTSEFKIIANVWSKVSDNVMQESFTVSKSTTERVKSFQENLIDKLKEFSQGESDKLLCIAVQHYKSQNYSSAEESFLRVIEIAPETIEAYFYIGFINFKKDNPDYERSAIYYNKGLEIDPNNKDILNYLSITYLKQEKYEEAIAALEKISEIEEDKEVWLKIGKIYTDIEEYENALEAYEKAIEIDDEYAEAYNEIAFILYDELEDFEKAIPCLEKVNLFYPDDEDIQKKLGKCYHKTGRLDSAILQYKKIIMDQPDNISAYFNLASAYRITNKLDKAIEILSQLKEKTPNNPKINFRLADCYYAKENFEQAKIEANKAIELDENLYEPYRVLSQVYQSIGYRKYEKYLELDERLPNEYGEQANKTAADRTKVKAAAYSDFTKSLEYIQKAENLTTSTSVLNDIKKRKEILKKLIEATKKGFF